MANVELRDGENLIKHSRSIWIDGKINKYGKVFLTDQRIIFHKISMGAFFLFGFFSVFTKGKYAFDLNLSDIKVLSKTRYRLNNNILLVKTNDGKEYRFEIKFPDWIYEIKSALLVHHKIKIFEKGAEKWVVQKKDTKLNNLKEIECKNCGANINNKNKYCSNCGQELKKTCEYCGIEVDYNTNFCSECGKKMVNKENEVI